MMRLNHGLAVLAVSALVLASAHAQESTFSDRITFKAGIFTPAKTPAKSVGSNWWVGGAEYSLGDPNAQKVNSIEGLYQSKSDTVSQNNAVGVPSRYKVLSLMLNHKIRNVAKDGTAVGNVLFYGAGVGANIVHVKISDTNPSGEGLIDKSRTVGGANLFIGYDMASNFQIEAKYQFTFSKVEKRDLSGLQFLVGVKF
jgi:hypothetical protein